MLCFYFSIVWPGNICTFVCKVIYPWAWISHRTSNTCKLSSVNNNNDDNNNNNNNSIQVHSSISRVSLHLLESELLVDLIQDRPPAPGRFPYSFWEVLYWVGRGWEIKLNIPTQGRRVQCSSERRWTALLTYGTGIRFPARNRTQAILVGGQCTTKSANWWG